MEEKCAKKHENIQEKINISEETTSNTVNIIEDILQTTLSDSNNSSIMLPKHSKENVVSMKNNIEEYLSSNLTKGNRLEENENSEKHACLENEKSDDPLKNEDGQAVIEPETRKILMSDVIKKECEENSKKVHKDLKNEVQKSGDASEYDPKNVRYEGELAIYEDPSTGYQYEWNKDTEEWIPRNITYGFEDDTHTYTDADGVKFFWDKEKNAWFPKINDDFMAQYQMNYGFVNNTSETPPKEGPPKSVEKEKQEPKGVKRKPSEPSWFELDEEQNTKVYVSNLPTDTTEEEFVDFMQKCGLIMRDPITQKMKIKLYTESGTNFLKGDALCTYIKIESVNLALKLLDGAVFKDKKVKVERARFQMKGEYDPKLKPKTKKKKEKQKLKKMQEKLFDWRPEKMRGERAKHEKVVIVKNLFDSKVFDDDVGLILEYQQDLREECSKCGEVRKVIIYDRHPEGIAQINMKEPEEADACVTLLNNRWFGKRQLTAEIWDGKTKYKIAETDSEISQRITKWDEFLEGEK